MIQNPVVVGRKSGTRKLTNKWSYESGSSETTFTGETDSSAIKGGTQ